MIDSRAFVAGATGYTGREVVRLLAKRGVETIAHVRPDSPRLEEWRGRFTQLGAATDVTPWDDAAMRETMLRLQPTHVFALLGTTRARGKRAAREGGTQPTYESVDYGLTALLLRAALAAGHRPRFIYLSAMGVHAGSRNPYIVARWRVESELAASGLEHVIARPAFVTGEDREENRPLERIAAKAIDATLGLAALLGARRLRDRFGSLTGTELAAGLVRLAFEPGVRGVVEPQDLRG